MEVTSGIPQQICQHCASHVTAIVPFLKLCQESAARWTYLSDRLLDIPTKTKANTAYIFVTGSSVRTVLERKEMERNLDPKNVAMSINRLPKEKKRQLSRKPVLLKALERTRQRKEKSYTCVECGSKYRMLSTFNHHLANQNKRLCAHCHKVVNLKTFAEHLQTHQIRFFKCTVCSLPLECEQQLKKHKKVHLGRNMCSECKRTFPTADILTLHVHRKHEPDVCNHCSLKFSNRICLYKHRSKCRSKLQKKYVCDYCSKEFSSRTTIKTHITLIHAKKRMHQCEHCGKQLNSACHLQEHYETHESRADRYVCPQCGNKYSTTGGFRRHVRLKHYSVHRQLKDNVKFSCDICSRDFISEKNLNNHLKAKKHKDRVFNNGSAKKRP